MMLQRASYTVRRAGTGTSGTRRDQTTQGRHCFTAQALRTRARCKCRESRGNYLHTGATTLMSTLSHKVSKS